MGNSMSYCVFPSNPAPVILLGLDGAGKTTILYKFLKPHDIVETFPTVGFNREQFTHRHFTMLFWDFGGKPVVRSLRPRSFQDYEAIIFVVDAADRNSFQEAREELWSFLKFAPDEMTHPVLMVLANKQDMKNAATTQEIEKVLDLKKLPNTVQYEVMPTCAETGNGLITSLDWLTRTIKENRSKNVTATYL